MPKRSIVAGVVYAGLLSFLVFMVTRKRWPDPYNHESVLRTVTAYQLRGSTFRTKWQMTGPTVPLCLEAEEGLDDVGIVATTAMKDTLLSRERLLAIVTTQAVFAEVTNACAQNESFALKVFEARRERARNYRP